MVTNNNYIRTTGRKQNCSREAAKYVDSRYGLLGLIHVGREGFLGEGEHCLGVRNPFKNG